MLYTKFWSPTMPGTCQKVCVGCGGCGGWVGVSLFKFSALVKLNNKQPDCEVYSKIIKRIQRLYTGRYAGYRRWSHTNLYPPVLFLHILITDTSFHRTSGEWGSALSVETHLTLCFIVYQDNYKAVDDGVESNVAVVALSQRWAPGYVWLFKVQSNAFLVCEGLQS